MVSLLFLLKSAKKNQIQTKSHPNGTVAFKMPGSLVHGNLRAPPPNATHPENSRPYFLGGFSHWEGTLPDSHDLLQHLLPRYISLVHIPVRSASTSTLPPQHDEIEVIGRLDPTEWRQCKSQVILRRASRDSILKKDLFMNIGEHGPQKLWKIVGISKGEKKAKVTEISGWIWMLCRLVWDDLIAVLFFCVTNSSGVRN